jgi:hypothetical protein
MLTPLSTISNGFEIQAILCAYRYIKQNKKIFNNLTDSEAG